MLYRDCSVSRGQVCGVGAAFQGVVALLGAEVASGSRNGDLASCGKLGNLLTVPSVFVADVCEKSFHSFALSVTSFHHNLLINKLFVTYFISRLYDDKGRGYWIAGRVFTVNYLERYSTNSLTKATTRPWHDLI